MKSFSLSNKKNLSLEKLKVFSTFILSILLYMQVFDDLTWFEDELRGHWVIKRLILASCFSLGYLLQYSFFKRRNPVLSKIVLGITVGLSTLLAIVCGINTLILLLIIITLLLLKVRKNELASQLEKQGTYEIFS
jgi:4-hydroxybenzoate polyprenyltransferase